MFLMYSSCTAACPAADDRKAARRAREKEIQQTVILAGVIAIELNGLIIVW